MKKVLFVCTGNTCRSPMAEKLFEYRKGDDLDWTAASAGIFADQQSPATPYSIEALKEWNLDLSRHRSQPTTLQLLKEADLIVTMTSGHQMNLVRHFPEVGNRVCLIKSFGSSKVPADISDPFGGSLNIYKKTRDEIDQAIQDLVLFLRKENP